MTDSDARSAAVRYPLIVVDRAKDPDRYDSGWLRLVERSELANMPAGPTVQIWDQAGRPATFTVRGPVLTDTTVDPAAREVLSQWRERMPKPYLATAPGGDTAIQHIVGDVAAAQSRLTPDGALPRPDTARRIVPVVLMLAAAVALIPLVRIDNWGVGVVLVWYVVAAALMHRWSYPPAWWGNPPRRDDPDLISRLAVASKVVFWAVAAAAGTLALLAWAGWGPAFLPWA